MSEKWIDANEYSFRSILLLERFQIRYMLRKLEKYDELGAALRYNPTAAWYCKRRCPEYSELVDEIVRKAPKIIDKALVRECEVFVMDSIMDFITYTTPDIMNTNCGFIREWDSERLYEIVELQGKTVLDLGAGNGRLTFAAAKYADEVYAVEPVGTLREYMRDKILREGIKNVRVTEGLSFDIPYPDNTFDVVMSGHVVGDNYDVELAELERVVKNGGWLIDCPGEDDRDMAASQELIDNGWEEVNYVSRYGTVVRRYRKQVNK